MCLFCKIAIGEIPSKVLFEDADLLAFHDVAPQAPVHVLVIPKRHRASLAEAAEADAAIHGKLALATRRVAEETGIAASGFRVVANSGADAGQSVHHLHLHVIGGRAMAWPPG